MNAVEILQNHHLKKSSPRVAIIQALQSHSLPMSEREIREEMGVLYDRVTFYRTVQTLLENGVIHRIPIENNAVRYALNPCGEQHLHVKDHVHFYCNSCHAVVCMDDIRVTKYVLPEGYTSGECDVLIKGRCAACNSTTNKEGTS